MRRDMSRILKKLNIEENDASTDPSSPDLKPNLKIAEESGVRPRSVQSKKKKPTQNIKTSFKRSLRTLVILVVISIASIGIFFGGKYAYQRIHKILPGGSGPVAAASAAGDALKAKLAGDEGLQQEALDFYQAKDYAKALEKFQFLQKKFPKDAALLNNLGLIYMKLDDLSKAEFNFQEALKIDPKDAATYNNFGSLRMVQKNWDEAIASFYQAILYHPAMFEAHLNLAKVYELAGRPMEAIPEYQTYLEKTAKIPGANPEIRSLIEKRIVKLNSYSRYLEQRD